MFQNKKSNPNTKSKLYNGAYLFFKPDYNPVIPMDIYQTWHTKDLPPKMRERVELLKAQNPRFNHHLFDDNDCREFIKTHFKPEKLSRPLSSGGSSGRTCGTGLLTAWRRHRPEGTAGRFHPAIALRARSSSVRLSPPARDRRGRHLRSLPHLGQLQHSCGHDGRARPHRERY